MPSDFKAQADRGAYVGRDVINSIIITGDHNKFFSGDYESLRDAYIEPWSVFDRVDLSDFVQRPWLLEEVDTFLKQERSGYLIIEAPAGLGKTAFIAWLARERGYVHHFAELAPGLDGVGRTLRSLAAQLVLAYHLSAYEAEGLLPSAASYPDFLYKLLKQAANTQEKGEKVVLVIDALDEAGTPHYQNVLGLPKVLPPGVFIVATQRPVSLMLEVDTGETPRRSVPLRAESSENLDDMRRYLSRATGWDEIRNALRLNHRTSDWFVRTLLDKAAGMWMYLHFVIQEIRRGERSLPKLDDLPSGLHQYYARHWSQWRNENEQEWGQVYLPIIGILAAAQQAVSAEFVRECGQVKREVLEVRRCLGEKWRPFVAVEGSREQPRYRFNHATLREFFSGQIERKKLTVTEAEFVNEMANATCQAHQKIIEYFFSRWNGLDTGLSGISHLSHLDDIDSYGLGHLATHLEEAKRADELHRLLQIVRVQQEQVFPRRSRLWRLLTWALGKSSCSTVNRKLLVWYTVRSHAGEVTDFLNDVDRAWKIADTARERGPNEGIAAIGLQVRYALLTASVRSLATCIPPTLLAALVKERVWKPSQALAYAIHHPDKTEESRLLLRLAPAIAELGYPAEALTAIKRITHGRWQSQALSAMAPHAADVWPALLDRAELLITIPINHLTGLREETNRDLVKGEQASLRADVLAGLIPHLPENLLSKACDVVRSAESPLDQVFLFAELLPVLPRDQFQAVFAEAIELARSVDDRFERILGLLKMWPYVSNEEKRGISRMAGDFASTAANQNDRKTVLINLIPLLAEVESPQVALDKILSLGSERILEAFTALIPRLPESFLSIALEAVSKIENGRARGATLMALAPRLSQPLLHKAVFQAMELSLQQYPLIGDRTTTLLKLGRYISDNDLRQTILECVTAGIQSLKKVDLWGGPKLPETLVHMAELGWVNEALQEVNRISNTKDRVEARAALISYVDTSKRGPALREMLKEVQHIEDSERQQGAIAALSIASSYPQRTLDIARRINNTELLSVLAKRLAKAGYSREALTASAMLPESSWDEERSRPKTLAAIAPDLSAQFLREASKMAWAIKDELPRFTAIAALIPRIPETDKGAIADKAILEARAITDKRLRAEIFVVLSPFLSESLLRETLTSVWSHLQKTVQARALISLAPHMREELLRENLTLVRTIEDDDCRATVLLAFAKKISGAERKSLLDEALDAAWAIRTKANE